MREHTLAARSGTALTPTPSTRFRTGLARLRRRGRKLFSVLATDNWPLATFSTGYWLLTTLCLLPACSPTYILRAGYEEAKILWHRRPIAEILQRPNLEVTTRTKLEMVLRVRHFVEQELAFDVGGSYSSVTEVTKPPIVYVVTAARRTKLEAYEWWFPIVGRVVYKGYFDENEAKKEMLRLEREGYDTYLRAAVAFSTLGWFADPLLPQLLRYNEETLTNIIIHELFHSTFYLYGQTALNESLANFAGHRGAIAFFARDQGDEAAITRQARATWESELAISRFVAEAVERLKVLYDSPVSDDEKMRQREELFTRLQEEFRNLPGPVRQNANFASVKLNNAVILHYLLYLQELALFEQIYQQNGRDLHAALARIIVAAKEEKEDPFSGVRALADSQPRIDQLVFQLMLHQLAETSPQPSQPHLPAPKRNGPRR